jgi:hypothetical protein
MATIEAEIEEGAGTERSPIGPTDISALEATLAAAGLGGTSLAGRYAVVFVYPGMGVGNVYPELAGCTLEVCTFIDEAAVFAKHGIQVVGISGEPTEPPPGCVAIPFPVGLLPQEAFGGPVGFVERGGRRYAVRTSFVIFPDRTGVRLSGVADVVTHVRACLELATEHRLERFRRAALASMGGAGQPLRTTAELRGLLPNGSDSVAITRLDVTVPLVCKMAAPFVVAEEAGYMDRVNRLLEERGHPRLFPAVVSIQTDEDPAWYLMEAADPVPLDRLVFADRERTAIDPAREHLIAEGVAKLANLYRATFRAQEPPVARYHYRDRFAAIPRREDTRRTYDLLVGGRLDEMLARPFVVDGVACRSYTEQLRFLEVRVDDLVQPGGALLHGDVHLPNMLRMGRELVFVDPRIVWDGTEVGDPGFGDPLYDLATLLHSVHVMSAILRAIDDDETEGLLAVEDGPDGVLRVAPGVLRIHGNPVLGWFRERVVGLLPRDVLGTGWEARLHVGTANALLGWLKSARSIRTRHAWLAVLASALYHLEVGRRLLEGEEA